MSDVSHNSRDQQNTHFEHHVSLNSRVHVRLRNSRLWLLLDHPPLNTLTVEMLEQLSTALQRPIQRAAQAQSSLQPTLVVLTNLGDGAFCEGVDAPDTLGERQVRLAQLAATICTTLTALREQGIQIVALVKGAAFDAGCELLSLCDAVIAREDAQFRLPAPNTHLFSCSTSTTIAQETFTRLAQERKTFDAREAMQLGLVHQVLTVPRFHTDAEELLVMLSSVARPENVTMAESD